MRGREKSIGYEWRGNGCVFYTLSRLHHHIFRCEGVGKGKKKKVRIFNESHTVFSVDRAICCRSAVQLKLSEQPHICRVRVKEVTSRIGGFPISTQFHDITLT